MTTTSIKISIIRLLLTFCIGISAPGFTGKTTTVRVERHGSDCMVDPNCFNRIHQDIEMRARAKPGDTIVFETRNTADIDLAAEPLMGDSHGPPGSKVHPMTGPVYIEGTRSGDVLAIEILKVEPGKHGFTLLHPIGFISDLFPVPHEIRWTLGKDWAESDALPGVRIPNAGFPGIVTVLPAAELSKTIARREAALFDAGGAAAPPEPVNATPISLCGPASDRKNECLRTFPPREHGGNLDIRYLGTGATLYLPCYQDGCGLAIGDVHYAQGDGEVSGTAIEMDALVTVTTRVMKAGTTQGGIHYEGPSRLLEIPSKSFYATTGYPIKRAGDVPPDLRYLESKKIGALTNLSKDVSLAARNALIAMIDYLTTTKGLTREQAYMLASVAVDLRIGQLVDAPNVVVSAVLPLDIFVEKARAD